MYHTLIQYQQVRAPNYDSWYVDLLYLVLVHYPQNLTGVVFCHRLAVGLVPPKTLTVGYLHRASGVWIRLLGPAVVTFVYQNPTRSFYTKSNYSTTPQNHHSTSQNNFKNQIFEQFTMPAPISILETCNI